MITYDKLWSTMKTKDLTQYKLIKKYHFSRGQINRLKHNHNINTNTLNTLCTILDCKIEDIVEFIKDEPASDQYSE